MAVKSRKEQHSEATRNALLKVARRLFAERGYADTGIEDVARRARVTRGALYHHFRDKQALFAAVFEDEERKLAQSLVAAASAEPDAWRRMVRGCAAFLDACLNPAVQRIVLIDAPAVLGWERWRKVETEYNLRLIHDGLQACIDEGSIEPQPVLALAHMLLGAFNEGAMMIAHADDEAAAKREVEESVRRLFSALKAAARPDPGP
ncbi:MAG TPA: helix-turn-helix domain-containing protein [Candidatus Binataceae bacterium]